MVDERVDNVLREAIDGLELADCVREPSVLRAGRGGGTTSLDEGRLGGGTGGGNRFAANDGVVLGADTDPDDEIDAVAALPPPNSLEPLFLKDE